MKNFSFLKSIFGGVLGSIAVLGSFAAISYVIAAPTQAPPNGNPSFPLQGPSGSTGSQGPQGPQGPAGTFGTCRHRQASCNSAAFAGCSVTANVTSGWTMTGGNCRRTPDVANYLVWNTGATSGSISCRCHDWQIATAGTCIANIWECQ